jgi:phosphotriesterase-related protein
VGSDNRTRITRRDAIRFLGAGAGLAAVAANPRDADAAVQTRTIVRTILEDIAPERLSGTTLIHEHLSMSSSAPTFYDDVGLIADEVKACAQDRVSCIVDTGNAGLGRKIDALRTIAARSGVHIVACGGLYQKARYPPDVLRKTADQIADDLVELAAAERWGAFGEIGTGIAVPTDPDERKALQAVAKAHVRTGLPIITHVSDGCAQCALDQVNIFEAAGANLQQVAIGHLNDIVDQPTVAPIAIAKRGAYLGFDHSGRPDDPRADEYVRTILAIIAAGFADRICLSSDFASAKYLRKNGGPGIDMIVKTIVPRLRRAGVPEGTLHTILVENPRRVLSFQPKTG